MDYFPEYNILSRYPSGSYMSSEDKFNSSRSFMHSSWNHEELSSIKLEEQEKEKAPLPTPSPMKDVFIIVSVRPPVLLPTYACQACKKTYSSSAALYTHTQKKHTLINGNQHFQVKAAVKLNFLKIIYKKQYHKITGYEGDSSKIPMLTELSKLIENYGKPHFPINTLEMVIPSLENGLAQYLFGVGIKTTKNNYKYAIKVVYQLYLFILGKNKPECVSAIHILKEASPFFNNECIKRTHQISKLKKVLKSLVKCTEAMNCLLDNYLY